MPVSGIDDQTCGSTAGGTLDSMYQMDELLRRCIGDRSLADALIEKFTSRLLSTVHDIERSLAARDWSRAASLVHNLKGEAGSLSAKQLQGAAASLEDCLGAGRQTEADDHFRRLKSLAKRCLSARAGACNR